MTSTGHAVAAIALAAAMLAASAAPSAEAAQRRRRAPVRRTQVTQTDARATVVLPYNQYFRLRMEDELNSDTSRVGDRFTATVVTPVYREGREVVPAGSTVGGRVTLVRGARTRGREGAIGVRFDTITLPDGTRVPITGSLMELQDEDAGNMSEEGVLEGRSPTRRRIYFIGGGAVGGALLGAIIGGGKGAGIGTAVGAGAGVAGVLLTKGHEAKVERGTEVGMVLDRAASIRVAR